MTTIRHATADDLDHVQAIEAASYAAPWSPTTFRTLLGRAGVRFLVAEASREVVGYAVVWEVADEAELANLAVTSAFRRRGVGEALLDRVLAETAASGTRAVFLEVRWSNDAALALYRKKGFEQIAVRKHYYERPQESARVLRLDLSLAPEGAGGSGLPSPRRTAFEVEKLG